MNKQIEQLAAKGQEASYLRVRKYALIRKYHLPENLIGGSLCHSYRRCGKPNCHCTKDQGHKFWSLTTSFGGKRQVQIIPPDWVEALELASSATQTYLDALKEVMAINVELLTLKRKERKHKKVREQAKKHTTKQKKLKK